MSNVSQRESERHDCELNILAVMFFALGLFCTTIAALFWQTYASCVYTAGGFHTGHLFLIQGIFALIVTALVVGLQIRHYIGGAAGAQFHVFIVALMYSALTGVWTIMAMFVLTSSAIDACRTTVPFYLAFIGFGITVMSLAVACTFCGKVLVTQNGEI